MSGKGLRKTQLLCLRLCNFKKIGHINDTFVIDTDQNRLVFFPNPTQVSLSCPPKNNVNDILTGLHRVPAACDIRTNDVHWPAKQTLAIDIEEPNDNSFGLDSISLPLVSLDKKGSVHDSLKELLKKLPKK